MKLTSRQFEEIMSAIDSDSEITPKIRTEILKKMQTCKDWDEFDLYLEKLEDKMSKKSKKKSRGDKWQD